MRYYFISNDGKQVQYDVAKVDRSKVGIVALDVVDSNKEVVKYFLRSVANKNFISKDNQTWRKIPKLKKSDIVVNVNETFKTYRGFKPSGLFNANAGDLVTDMPGKVVKLLTTEGAVVNQGDTLLILEAMKMENEIKAGVSGVVKSVHVKEGQVLEAGFLMIEIEE
jgi:biotin carboxyl carrier protein